LLRELSINNQTEASQLVLKKLGFRLGPSGVHIGRTLMLEELRTLFSFVPDSNSKKSDYIKAIIADNCLGKRSQKNRELSARHLMTLYSLDPSANTFQALKYFWTRDIEAQPLLALLSAYSRDGLLRMSAPFILSLKEGEVVDRDVFEQFLDKKVAGRLSESCLKSLVRNLCGTWVRSGHLKKAELIRLKAQASVGSMSNALFLGYLMGVRGETLFSTDFMRLLDVTFARSIELAEEASRRGWLVFNHIDKIMEVRFPRLIADSGITI
jgi:hypothetical protein